MERTLSIIKPDAVKKDVIGQIYARFEGAGLKDAVQQLSAQGATEGQPGGDGEIFSVSEDQNRPGKLGGRRAAI